MPMPGLPGQTPPMPPGLLPPPQQPRPTLPVQPGAGGGGAQNPMEMFMAFLAGAGFRDFTQNIAKLRNKQGQGADREHRGGVRMEAAQNPGTTIAPQLAQMMARNPGQSLPGLPPGAGVPGAPTVPPSLQPLLDKLMAARGLGGGMGGMR